MGGQPSRSTEGRPSRSTEGSKGDRVRILLVHGRGEKPSRSCKLRYVRQVLTESVRRADPSAGRWLARHPEAVELAYYADLIRRLLKVKPEPCRSFKQPIRRLFQESRSCPTWMAFQGFLKDLGGDAAGALSRLLTQPIWQRFLAERFFDVSRYFSDPRFARSIRGRLAKELIPALRSGEMILLIGHSLGTVVAFDLLWEISHLAKYKAVRHRSVDCFVTLGSPLGDEKVRRHLVGAREPLARRFPTNIRRWRNFSARGDLICHDAHLANDFRFMRRHGLLQELQDVTNLCSVYRGRDGQWNPHKLYGYLILPEVGRLVAEFLRASIVKRR